MAIEAFCAANFDERPAVTVVETRWPHGGFELMRLYCFATAADAEAFATYFDGEHFDHKTVREGKRTFWLRPGCWSHRVRYGPLGAPQWLRDSP